MTSVGEERLGLLKALRDLQPVGSAWAYKQQGKALKRLQALLTQVKQSYR